MWDHLLWLWNFTYLWLIFPWMHKKWNPSYVCKVCEREEYNQGPKTSHPSALGMASSQSLSEELDEAVMQTINNKRPPSSCICHNQIWKVFFERCCSKQLDLGAHAPSTWFDTSIFLGLRKSICRYYGVCCCHFVFHWGTRWSDAETSSSSSSRVHTTWCQAGSCEIRYGISFQCSLTQLINPWFKAHALARIMLLRRYTWTSLWTYAEKVVMGNRRL